MRLICPNCDAQYEVDAGLIPDSGRDVQCSDCGHVWFQAPEGDTGHEAEDVAAIVGAPPAPHSAPRPAAAAPAAVNAAASATSAAATAAPATVPAPAAPDPLETMWPGPTRHDEDESDPQVLRRHALDESLLSVLREEAERETRARAEEAARHAGRGVEIQPELGLDGGGPAPGLRIRPRARPRPETPASDGHEDDTMTGAAPVPGAGNAPPTRAARRELLPDIDRINSTLDASNALRKGGNTVRVPDPPERQRSGFRRGFLAVVLLGALAWGAYAESARLAEALPQAGPLIDGYVTMINKARSGLDGLVKGLLDTLNG